MIFIVVCVLFVFCNLCFVILIFMPKNKKYKKEKEEKKLKLPKLDLHPDTKREIWGVAFFAFAVVSLLSFFGAAGVLGREYFRLVKLLFGFGFFLIPLSFALAGLILLKFFKFIELKEQEKPLSTMTVFIGVGLFTLSILGLINILSKKNGGGYLGLAMSYPFFRLMGFAGTLVVLISLFIISLLIMFNIPLRQLFRLDRAKKGEVQEAQPGLEVYPEEKRLEAGLAASISEKEEPPVPEVLSPKNREINFSSRKQGSFSSPWASPPLDLLLSDNLPAEFDEARVKANINTIKRTLNNFKIEVEMGEVNVGPTVTQYTLRPAVGIKLSNIVSLHNDLALALATHPIRIEAPIPGKSLVGIEVPNRVPALVRLRGILESKELKNRKSNLALPLGRNVAGAAIFDDLGLMPHLLVAGATGSGKSICINSIITSLIYQNSPRDLRFVLIDPKRVELTLYNGIPHLLTPVIVNAEKTINALRWTVKEMEQRYELLSEAGSRDIVSFNEFIRKKEGKESENHLPYIVFIIDELADIMISHGREVESLIIRLAQMARAVGIHLVISTQRPSIDVITGLIKANITSRIAFQVASQVDSRTILDISGAEKLLGRGDMLYLAGDLSKPVRLQGAFISEKEVKNLVSYLGHQPFDVEYKDEVGESQKGGSLNLLGEDMDDELYEEARGLVVKAQKASASFLQRRLKIGYARAARILDLMEEEGVVGPSDGAKPRKIMVSGENNEEYI